MLGESTRLTCAAALNTQATYNLFKWKKFIPKLGLALLVKRKLFYNASAQFYGYPTYKDFKKHKRTTTKSLDMLNMIDENDPPIYFMNLMKETKATNMNVIQHHKNHAIEVAKHLKRNKVEHQIYTYTNEVQKEADVAYKVHEFLVKHLKEASSVEK